MYRIRVTALLAVAVAWVTCQLTAAASHAGDLRVWSFPFAARSYIREWADVLDKLMQVDVETIVPGHDRIMHDKAYLSAMAALMRSVSTQVRAGYRPAMTADEVRGQIDIESSRDKFAGGDRFVDASFDYMVTQLAVDRAVEEEQGALKPEG